MLENRHECPVVLLCNTCQFISKMGLNKACDRRPRAISFSKYFSLYNWSEFVRKSCLLSDFYFAYFQPLWTSNKLFFLLGLMTKHSGGRVGEIRVTGEGGGLVIC